MLMTGERYWRQKTAESFTNILKLSPIHLVSNIRHRHTCGEMIFTVPVILTSAVELQAILTVETSLDVDVQLLNP